LDSAKSESLSFIDVPYIANFIYENPGLQLHLKGIWIADPSLSYGVVQQEIPALRFAQVGDVARSVSCLIVLTNIWQANKNLFPFNSSFWNSLQNISDTCGYTDYLDKFVTYPPKGHLPFPAGVVNGTFGSVTASCRIHSPIQREIGRYA
jgi:carboxypeptidase D